MREFENSTSTASTKAIPAPASHASVPAPANTSAFTTIYRKVEMPEEKVGHLTYTDLQVLCGTAAAERLFISRKTDDLGIPAEDENINEIRENLISSLQEAGFRLREDEVYAVRRGDYYLLRRRVEKSGKVAALDCLAQAERLEERLRSKHDRQVLRGARAFRQDKTDEKIAVLTTAAVVVNTAVKVITTLKKLAK